MKHIKLFENHNEYYSKISHKEYNDIIQSDEIFCFDKYDKKAIERFLNSLKDNYDKMWFRYKFLDAKLWYDYHHRLFYLTDDHDLDKSISSSIVTINKGDEVKRIDGDLMEKDDDGFSTNIIIEDFSLSIDYGDSYYIYVTKCRDEWFLLCDDNLEETYKCDQLSGLLKYLEEFL